METLINGGSHTPNLRRCENFGQAQFAPKRNGASAQICQNAGMSIEQEERDRLRSALVAFYEKANKEGKIRSVRAWVTAAEIGYNTLNDAIKGKRNKRLEDETYFSLAIGASKLLDRPVSVAELQGLPEPKTQALDDAEKQILTALADIGSVDEAERRDLEDLIHRRAAAARARKQRAT